MVIHDSLINELLVFKERSNIFEDYLFTPFFFKPLSDDHMKRIMKELVIEKNKEDWVEAVFENFYSPIQLNLRPHTSSICEYQYICTFLFPYFTEPLKNAKTQEEKDRILGNMIQLSRKEFK